MITRAPRASADLRRHEHAIAPHDRARVRKARDGRAPQDVFAPGSIPAIGQVLSIRDAGRVRSAERGPASGRRRRFGQPGRALRCGAEDLPGNHGLRRAGRPPAAVVQDHAPRRAFVSKDGQRNVRSLHAETVTARRLALRRPSGRDERDGVAIRFPRALECRPPLPCQGERAVGCERHREAAVLQRRGRELRRLGRDEGERAEHEQGRWCEAHGARMVAPAAAGRTSPGRPKIRGYSNRPCAACDVR